MGIQKFANNAEGTTTTPIAIGGTSFSLQSGQGAEFPTLSAGAYFYGRLGSNSLNEVVKVTARTSDTLTCEAATMAWAAGTAFILCTSAEMLDEFAQIDGTGQTLDGHKLQNYTEASAVPASASGTLTLDYSLGPVFVVTLDEDVTTLAFSNLPATGQAAKITLILVQDGTGGWDVTWPAAVDWVRGWPDPDLSPNSVTVVTLITVDAGTTWWGVPHNHARPRVSSLGAGAATIAVNTDGLDQLKVTLGANGPYTLGADAGDPYDGKLILLIVTQDATGSRTLAYTGTATGWVFTTDVPEPTLSTAANAIDYLLFRYHGTDDRWHCLAVNLGA